MRASGNIGLPEQHFFIKLKEKYLWIREKIAAEDDENEAVFSILIIMETAFFISITRWLSTVYLAD